MKKSREITGSIYRAFLDTDINIDVDLLTVDADRYVALCNEIGYIYKTIKQEGKVLYGTV